MEPMKKRKTVSDAWNSLTEVQKYLFHEYMFEVCNGYLGDRTRKAYAKMALSELNGDQLKVLAWMEAKLLAEKKGKSDE